MELNFSLNEGVGVLVIEGRLDATNHHDLERRFKEFLKEATRFVFDLEGVDFVDSTGLGAIVSCLKSAAESEGDIVIANLQPKPRMVFNITRAYKIFDIFDSVDSALQKIRADL